MVHLEEVIEMLSDEKCRDYVLDIMYSIANQIPIALESYLYLFDQKSTYYDSFKIDKIIGLIGKSLKGKAEFCTNLLIQRIRLAQQKSSKVNSLNKRFSFCVTAAASGNATGQRYSYQLPNVNGSILHDSIDDLDDIYVTGKSHRSTKTNASNSVKKSHSYCYRNNYNNNVDSDEYHMITNQSNNSGHNLNANDPKKCVQILEEIAQIASVHPHVLGRIALSII